MKERGIGCKLIRGGRHEVAEVPDDLDGRLARIENKAAQHRVYRASPELKRRHHPEVPTAAAQSPEEIFVFSRAGRDDFAVGSDDLAREQVIDRHAVLAQE